jgi:hypothetical protein
MPAPGACHPHAIGLYDRLGDLLPGALRAFEPTCSTDRRMPPLAAEMLRVDRHAVECGRLPVFSHHQIEPLSRWCWCAACGALFEDRRVARGQPITGSFDVDLHGDWDDLESVLGGVAKWCPACRGRRTRHNAVARLCAAPGCEVDFAPRNARQSTCSNACRKRLGDWQRRHASRRRLRERLEREDRAAGYPVVPYHVAPDLPCIGASCAPMCECVTCVLDRHGAVAPS